MNKIIFSVLLLSTSWVHAQLANLPDTADIKNIGRLKVFASVQPYSWFTPTAFRSEMECTKNTTGSKRTCTIKIFNSLDSKESEMLATLAEKQKLNILPFSNVDGQVVTDIREAFTALPTDVAGDTMSLKTMALSDGMFPYASFMFRADKARVSELEDAYANEGLGAFTVSFALNTQNTEIYLAIRDGQCLKKSLVALDGKNLKKSDVNSSLVKTMNDCGLSFTSYDANEARDYMMFHLRDTFFSFSKSGGFALKRADAEKIGERYTLHSDVSAPQLAACETTLPLKALGIATTICKLSGGETL